MGLRVSPDTRVERRKYNLCGRRRLRFLLLIAVVMYMTVTACHPRYVLPPQSLVVQDPLDSIAVHVMMATSRGCDTVQLRRGPKEPVFGCVAQFGDTTAYFYQANYQNWHGPILIAGREWHAPPADAAALATQFDRMYGHSRTCIDVKKARYRQWRSASFVVVLEEGHSSDPLVKDTGLWLQYVKGSISCDFTDSFYWGTRPLERL
jgi:hypothetical protein